MSAPAAAHEQHARVLALLRRHGWNATSFQVLEPGFRYWFEDDRACVAYVDTGGAWVAAGAPIAPEEELAPVAARFVQAARAAGRRCCFFATEARFAHAAHLGALHVGEQPVWDPAEWEATLEGSRSLREQVRRSRAKGVVVRALAPEELEDPGHPTRRAVERLIARWLGSRPMGPMGFLVQLDPFSAPRERRHFVAERDGALVGFLAAVPVYARQGWFLEDLLRDPAAPNGTTELLVDGAMRALAREGSGYATLGLAPLAGAQDTWLRAARDLGAELYDFEGLRAFKAKLRPRHWDPLFLSYPRGQGALVSLYDALRAFAGGSLLRFGLQTLRRGPPLVWRVLGAALVPWTALLALAPDARFFPSPWVKWGWVAFDVGVAAGMLSLARRWRRGLATLLAAAVTGDALLTLAQVALFNAPRAQGPLDWALVGVSQAAPTFAAWLLWSARQHHARLA